MKKSVSGKIWQQSHINNDYVEQLKYNFAISDFLAKILSTKVTSLQEAAEFLSPKIKDSLPDPFHLLDMNKAVERTIFAIKHQQKICIFGDYDVDGATSSALLKNLFFELGQVVDIYIPDRILEGYGPTLSAMQLIKNRGTDLVITVDCGTAAKEAIKYASTIELDIIVIDHHVSLELIPEAIAIVNPNRLDENSKYKYLAAVGVCFLFAVALVTKLKKYNYFISSATPNLMNYLDLVAIGTVCDVMPIIGLNRVFVSQGLKIIQNRHNLGLRALLDISSVQEKISCYHLGFTIGPRINAGGRVGKSDLGAMLLTTEDQQLATKFAHDLNKYNEDRKYVESVMLAEAIAIAQTQIQEQMLFIVGDKWHPGVIGIIAGRLKEKFHKPTAVITVEDGIAKASCRSIKGIDFGVAIIEAKNLGLVSAGGGHSMAAGFTTTCDKLNELCLFLNKNFEQKDKKNSQHIEYYSTDLTTNSLNLNLMKEISQLEPFGNGNPAPLFKFSNLFVLKADIVGEKHVRCLLVPERKNSYATSAVVSIAFNAASSEIGKILMSKSSSSLSVIAAPKLNSWQRKESVQIQIVDIIV
ncbi:MAG: single-stranded-DNA-specific exonuclease RecJ [Rickettsiaceae bacterium]|nr:MAG: single-stranded-DNA-specific exonuclease RecJ [Rickettsiaceae bacterium]